DYYCVIGHSSGVLF
nr:immunoglobulin light chain junction region [Macaca mulatta]MOW18250.1 immunoglobulin light chain junction region [Macaca mulatta]